MSTYDLSAPENLLVAGVKASYFEYLHACPICLAGDLTHYCRVPSLFNREEFICYERCRSCGVVMRNPRLPSTYRERRYENRDVTDSDTVLELRRQIHYQHMARLMRRLIPSSSKARLLDFGCGAGGFLLEMKNAGFEVMGLELNKALASHVEGTFGIRTHQGLITDAEFAEERFNVIISSQVLEHLVDPRATLIELRRHLLPPGIVLIEVPNLRHIRERLRKGALMDDSHLFYFSAKSLPRMLRDTGFSVVKIQEGLRPYRVLGSSAHRLPDWAHDLGERLLSALQIKTGLSVIARLS